MAQSAPTASVSSNAYSFTPIDVPGAVNGTYPTQINRAGQIIGDWYDSNNVTHGFLDDNGTITTIDPSGATSSGPLQINNAGQILGEYTDSSGKGVGFLDYKGTFTTIDVPGSIQTSPAQINASGRVVGQYVDSVGGKNIFHGFLYYNGKFTTIDPPGSTYSAPSLINNSGQIAGFYGDGSGADYGFFDNKGKFMTIDPPGSRFTDPSSMNNSGEVVGRYYNPSEGVNGEHVFSFYRGNMSIVDPFPNPIYNYVGLQINNNGQFIGEYIATSSSFAEAFLDDHGKVTILGPPGSTSSFAAMISNSGEIVGDYFDSGGASHGFLYENGKYTTIDAPGSLGTTFLNGINGAGQIIGSYYDANFVSHSFVASPNDCESGSFSTSTRAPITQASVRGDSQPALLGTSNAEDAAGAGALARLGSSGGLGLQAIAGAALAADLLPGSRMIVAGSSPALSWATFPNPLPNIASGALPHPKTSGNWMPSLHPV